MPTRSGLQTTVQRAFHRVPALGALGLAALDLVYRVALLPFRRSTVKGQPLEPPDLIARTDAFNQAAERYFSSFPEPQYLLDKPFSEQHLFAKHLIDAGVLVDGLRLAPGDVVAEIGAGSCWLSHLLNRFGCPTIAIDVSPTALALGRTLFERDPRTRWDLHPQFVAYDGHRLPLDDASCDRIVINDAFHHIPNQRELLLEMRRILRPGGIVAMAEPGRGHGSTEQSLAEEARAGVLENELVLEDVAALARACGFHGTRVIVASPLVRHEIAADDLSGFMGGRGFAAYWKTLCAALEQHHYILLLRDAPDAVATPPRRLSARIHLARARPELRVAVHHPARLGVRITNTGESTWPCTRHDAPGWTRLGAHLYGAAPSRELIDFDWFRANLPTDLPPGRQLHLELELPALAQPGEYLVVFDLVAEGVAWFADQGSGTATQRLVVV